MPIGWNSLKLKRIIKRKLIRGRNEKTNLNFNRWKIGNLRNPR